MKLLKFSVFLRNSRKLKETFYSVNVSFVFFRVGGRGRRGAKSLIPSENVWEPLL